MLSFISKISCGMNSSLFWNFKSDLTKVKKKKKVCVVYFEISLLFYIGSQPTAGCRLVLCKLADDFLP